MELEEVHKHVHEGCNDRDQGERNDCVDGRDVHANRNDGRDHDVRHEHVVRDARDVRDAHVVRDARDAHDAHDAHGVHDVHNHEDDQHRQEQHMQGLLLQHEQVWSQYGHLQGQLKQFQVHLLRFSL